MRLLLDHGASPIARSLKGTTPLHAAAQRSNPRFFNLLLQCLTEPDALQILNDFGETILHFACLGSQLELIEMLLDRDLDVRQRSALGWTPLMFALAPDVYDMEDREDDWSLKGISFGIDAARLLMARAADAEVVSDQGWTPLHVLCLHQDHGNHNEKLYRFAIELIQQDKSVLEAAEPEPMPEGWHGGPWNDSRWLMSREESPGRDMPLLHWAIERQSATMVKALLDVGVDPMVEDERGMAAVMAAKEYWWKDRGGQTERAIQMLLAKGAAENESGLERIS